MLNRKKIRLDQSLFNLSVLNNMKRRPKNTQQKKSKSFIKAKNTKKC